MKWHGAVVLFVCASGCGETRNAGGADSAAVSVDTPALPAQRSDTAASAASRRGCAAPATSDDRTICGKLRVGPITAATTRAQLNSLFQPDLLVDEQVHLGEGEMGPGTRVNRGRPDSATVVWNDSTRTRIRDLLRLGPSWRTEQGLGVGSSLQEIVTALGPRVVVLGYGWDYGGTVLLNGTALENSGIFFRTEPRNQTAPAYARVQGDKPFDASSADVRALDPVVHMVDVSFR